jgi:hypothetical protein
MVVEELGLNLLPAELMERSKIVRSHDFAFAIEDQIEVGALRVPRLLVYKKVESRALKGHHADPALLTKPGNIGHLSPEFTRSDLSGKAQHPKSRENLFGQRGGDFRNQGEIVEDEGSDAMQVGRMQQFRPIQRDMSCDLNDVSAIVIGYLLSAGREQETVLWAE